MKNTEIFSAFSNREKENKNNAQAYKYSLTCRSLKRSLAISYALSSAVTKRTPISSARKRYDAS